MPTPRFHQRAREDVEELWLFIAQEDIAAADRYLDELEERAHTYAMHPDIGQIEPDIAERLERAMGLEFPVDITIRSFLHRNHRCYYIPDDEGIYILRVIDMRREQDRATRNVTYCDWRQCDRI
ncbi:MAG: type II toxin-antitoxin system RelE/ParE family toxin [Candidatus Tectomicrobia bacterium]|nr:type II toxin-antitoxin system RelE/ParE family toxin [Candidatus Tectomicrobia bacterium]